MKAFYLLLIILLFFPAGCKKNDTEDPRIEQMSHQKGYNDWLIEDFRCGLFVPPSYDASKKYPLIIYLHGYTDTTTWNLEWYNEPVLSQDPCIVLTPKCPVEEVYRWGDSWDPGVSPMIQKTFEMLGLVEQAFSLDYDRYYIYGTSMGGYGTYGVIQKNPDMFAAGYVICGAGDPEMAGILADIPFWIFHGSVDQNVLVSYARNMYQAVIAAGGTQIRYTEYEGVGHNSWENAGNETTRVPWLLAQRRGAVHGHPDSLSDVSVSLNTQQHVSLEWEFPTDRLNSDNQIWYVRIYREGVMIKEVYNDQLAYTDSIVNPGETYGYRFSVVNYFFNESDLSYLQLVTIPE